MTTTAPAPRAPVHRTLRGFDRLAATVGASDPPWLQVRREAAAARFVETGLPASNDEEWRFTPLHDLAQQNFVPAADSGLVLESQLAPHLVGAPSWPLLVLVDGVVSATLSRVHGLPAGVTFTSLSDALAAPLALVEQYLGRAVGPDATPFAAANLALVRDGAVLHVAGGVTFDTPLRVVHVTTGGSAGCIVSPRLLVVCEDGAQATLVESYVDLGSNDVHLTNSCAEVVLGRTARLEHIRLQRESAHAWHVGFTGVDQAADSHYRSFVLACGARLSRHNLHAQLNGMHVETLLYGLYLTQGDQLADNHTAIFHDHPACNSWEVYKGVLADRSRAVFNGKVLVHAEAQQTDAKQTNRNLLLSDTARVDTKPQLEIFADDVRCTHGATVGPLDPQQRYYLRTRGIAGREAEVLLVSAFVAEVVAEIGHAGVRSAVDTIVRAEMAQLIG